ncbi:MAG: Serine protease 56, partial [Marteilia pararefringens]
PFEIIIEHLNIGVDDKECGENFVEIRDASGVLTRQCGGEIYDASFKTAGPWFEVKVVGNGKRWSASLQIRYETYCGVRLAPPGPHASAIVGGTVSEKQSWPWVISLKISGQHLCGGSLINNQWILSAAHCFEISSDPTDWMATIGEFDLRINEGVEQSIPIASIIIHPDFDLKSYDNDYALVKLNKPIGFDEYAAPVCLPKQGSALPPDGTNSYVTGWGDTETEEESKTLREVEVEIISAPSCRKTKYKSERITANMFCAGYEAGGKDSCQGDSGGPLVYYDKDSGSFYQLGITSWGKGCADPGYPGVYSRVDEQADWIDRMVSEN